MSLNEKKIARLTKVARMYYEADLSQNEIARDIGVSRPMVSKLLREAKELGIVTVKINNLQSKKTILMEKIASYFNLKDVIIISEEDQKQEFMSEIAKLLKRESPIRVGIGCGSVIGEFTDYIENGYKITVTGEIFPLIGGFKATYRSYHTDELVRSIAAGSDLKANYLYLPALLASSEEKSLYKATELYQKIESLWEISDINLLNISTIYTTPDLATSIRFGSKLGAEGCVGRFLAHYYDIDGNFIEAKEDIVIQAEVEKLAASKDNVALCLKNNQEQAIIGALNTKLFTKIIITEQTAEKIVERLTL